LAVPLPEGASVRGFAFSGRAKEPTAEILPRDAALATYKSIVATMKDPAILEFAGWNVVRSSLFPLEPYGTQKVRLTYEHILPADGHRIDYMLPRTDSINYKVPWEVSIKIQSKQPISAIYSPSHQVECKRVNPQTAVIHIGKTAMNEPGSLHLAYLQDAGDMVTASLLSYPDPQIGGGYFLLLAGLPAAKPALGAEAVRREMTLVIDRSGSMAGEKIEQVKAAALQVVQGLEDGEAFNIIDYSDYLASFAARPVVKNKENLAAACRYIRKRQRIAIAYRSPTALPG
jgi:Ca-activated chloride channel family protein